MTLNNAKQFFICFFILTIIWSCGSPEKSKLFDLGETKVPVVVMMGGYLSCEGYKENLKKTRIMQFSQDFFNSLKNESLEPRLMIACFEKNYNKIRFSVADNPSHSLPGKIADLKEAIIQEVLQQGEAKSLLYVVGYSYGGWLALKVASELATSSGNNVAIQGLQVIDPISPVTCTPTDFAKAYIGFGVPKQGCLTAPKDLETSFPTIKNKNSFWVQFYQLSDRIVHSNRIEEADENLLLDFPEASSDKFGPHLDMQKDQRVWKKVTEVVLKDFR